jgi:hypothetical protein
MVGESEVPRDLAVQEARARPHPKPMETPPLDPAKLQPLAEAAKQLAERVAEKDDRQFVEVFQRALNAVVNTELPTEEANVLARIARPPIPSAQSIFSDPNYVKNAREFIRSPSRIVGGVPTADFPDCVAVGSAAGWCCTGTLIAPNVVLSAGHCAALCADRVFLGLNVDGDGQAIPIAAAHRHPQYATGGLHNDLVVLILVEDVPGVAPRRVAAPEAITAAAFIRAVGFGTTDPWGTGGYGQRRVVDVPIATADCAADDAQSRYGCDELLELVAGAPFLDRDSCKGDSGGPAYVQAGSDWFLAGATSRATNEALRPCGDGGVYVRVDRFMDWIMSVPGGHWSGEPPVPPQPQDQKQPLKGG